MLAETATFVESFCARHGFSRDDALRLTLVIEELFTNTVMHGYRGDSDAPISIELSASEREIAVRYEDEAPAYDPLSQLADRAPIDGSVETRPVGGLGMRLVEHLARRASYARENGRNRLWLRVRCGA